MDFLCFLMGINCLGVHISSILPTKRTLLLIPLLLIPSAPSFSSLILLLLVILFSPSPPSFSSLLLLSPSLLSFSSPRSFSAPLSLSHLSLSLTARSHAAQSIVWKIGLICPSMLALQASFVDSYSKRAAERLFVYFDRCVVDTSDKCCTFLPELSLGHCFWKLLVANRGVCCQFVGTNQSCSDKDGHFEMLSVYLINHPCAIQRCNLYNHIADLWRCWLPFVICSMQSGDSIALRVAIVALVLVFVCATTKNVWQQLGREPDKRGLCGWCSLIFFFWGGGVVILLRRFLYHGSGFEGRFQPQPRFWGHT